MRNKLLQKSLVALVVIIMASAFGVSIDSLTAKESQKNQVKKVPQIDQSTLYVVNDVVDGDTFKIDHSEGVVTVRMLGVDTPEIVDPRKGPQCYGEEASDFSKQLLSNQKVRLVLNPNREVVDKYGRVLAYVYLSDGTFVNEKLLSEGYAREYTFGKAYDYQKQFKLFQASAMQGLKGLWSTCGGV